MPHFLSTLRKLLNHGKPAGGHKRAVKTKESPEDARHRRQLQMIASALLIMVILACLVIIVRPGSSNDQFNLADRLISGVMGGVIGFLSGRR
jgi:hypothetical protein